MKLNNQSKLIIAILFLGLSQGTWAQKRKKGQESIEYTYTMDNYNKGAGGPLKNQKGLSVSKPAPFLFTTSTGGSFGVPSNKMGVESSSSQNDNEIYAGIVAYSPGKTGDNERSFMCFDLEGAIEMRKKLKYCVSYEVSLAESSKFAVNGLGILFSKEQIAKETPKLSGDEDHLVLNPTNGKDSRDIIKGFAGWEKVGYVYTAKGDEKYVTIGNFIPNPAYGAPEGIWKLEKIKKPKASEVESMNHAFYYVDNLSIKLIQEDEECDCFQPKKKNLESMFSSISYNKVIRLDDLKTPKEQIEAHSLHFKGGKASFSSNAVKYMDYIAAVMNENENLKLEVIGHCAEVENEAGQQDEQYKNLDIKRADLTIKYLVKKGVSSNRLTPVYKGSQEMSSDAVENDDDEIKEAKNRRVEFSVKE